jgi:hypothetical protein
MFHSQVDSEGPVSQNIEASLFKNILSVCLCPIKIYLFYIYVFIEISFCFLITFTIKKLFAANEMLFLNKQQKWNPLSRYRWDLTKFSDFYLRFDLYGIRLNVGFLNSSTYVQ